jgi:hypothetical protein
MTKISDLYIRETFDEMKKDLHQRMKDAGIHSEWPDASEQMETCYGIGGNPSAYECYCTWVDQIDSR